MVFWPFKSNFTFIAENTTKFYLELEKCYKAKFVDRASLLATAGVLDAYYYIFKAKNPQITIEDIVELARDSSIHDEDHPPMRKLISFQKRFTNYKRGKASAIDMIVGDDEEKSSAEINELTDDLFDFVYKLEMTIFMADNPRISPSRIEESCQNKYKTIEKAIIQTIRKHKVGKGKFAKTTTMLMESPRLLNTRQQLGIAC